MNYPGYIDSLEAGKYFKIESNDLLKDIKYISLDNNPNKDYVLSRITFLISIGLIKDSGIDILDPPSMTLFIPTKRLEWYWKWLQKHTR